MYSIKCEMLQFKILLYLDLIFVLVARLHSEAH
jgi:hypothetical protein